MITSENQNFLDIFFEEAEDFLIKYPNNNRLKEIKIVKEKLSLEHAFFYFFLIMISKFVMAVIGNMLEMDIIQ